MGNTESSTIMENENPENEISSTQTLTTTRRHSRRRYETVTIEPEENPWWSRVESENLILEQVPNELTSVNENRIEIKNFPNENVNLTLKKCEKNVEILETAKINENFELQKTDLNERTERAAAREQSLEEFREELRQKRLARQTAVQDLRDEITTLRKQLANEQARTQNFTQKHDDTLAVENLTAVNIDNNVDDVSGACACGSAIASTDLQDMDDVDPMSRGRHANIELANAQLALQLANSENISLRAELGVVQKQVGTLKEVISCCKQMLAVKEEQCNELKAKLTEIETSLGEREMKIMSENLRHEYERQLGNIRQLRELYEERQRISAAEHENLQRLISIKKDELLAEQEKTKNFEERNQTLIKEVENANNELATLREECNEHKFEKKALKEEMGAVNTLFSQMVMGFNGKNNLDIDRLTTMLEENRTLLNDMATKEASCTDGATLPKLLFELVEQAMYIGNKSGNSSLKTSRCTTPIPIPLEEEFQEQTQMENKQQKQMMQELTQNIHNETIATNMNNDVDVATTIDIEDADAVDHVINSEETEFKQLNIATNNGSGGGSSGDADDGVKNFKRQHQRRKLQATTSSSSSSATPSASTVAIYNNTNAVATMKFHEPEVIGKVASAQEIIGNLPKVWKVLMELLSHHKIEQTQFEENGNSEDCYKSVETPNGPKAELSVSKTYIKLKDLILEKKSLVKETNRLKTLNSHLEYRLNAQEKRLSTVSMELTKTWHLVGKMQRQHRQLHTQEQILRYQLQQKRRLLSELKEELEYCRRKWAAARAKNDESQEQCNDLRREFARRKLEDANNSAESGYSDSGPPSDEEGGQQRESNIVGDAVGGGSNASGSGAVCSNSRRKHLREMFEHTRKIKRMQSTSPGRAAAAAAASAQAAAVANNTNAGNDENNVRQETEIILRWNSAPPTCGWRRRQRDNEENNANGADGDDDDEEEELPPRLLAISRGSSSNNSNNRGAIPKQQNENRNLNADACSETKVQGTGRATRIQRLEEQCKSLIQQVLETSDNRERLEIQLCRFQDEIAPVQYAVPLEEFINKRRTERMSRASSAPATGSLTPREEEYTRKRSERLERLEEESRQLMSRIKRTSDRGHYLRCSLDRIRRGPSRDGSFDSATEDDSKKSNTPKETADSENCVNTTSTTNTLTAEEEAYTAKRAARLRRLEEEGQQLLGTLTRTAQRSDAFKNKLDALHERYGDNDKNVAKTANEIETNHTQETQNNIEQRLENIDQATANRAERLRLLEVEGNQLIARLSNTSERGTRMINRIAEHEQRREARLNAKPNSEQVADKENSDVPDVPTVLLPTLQNVACSSIVGDEVSECVAIVATPSQVALHETGAIPKSMPTAQLCAARHKSERFASEKKSENSSSSTTAESLEELVKRLRETPFPAEDVTDSEEKKESTIVESNESMEPTNEQLNQPDSESKN